MSPSPFLTKAVGPRSTGILLNRHRSMRPGRIAGQTSRKAAFKSLGAVNVVLLRSASDGAPMIDPRERSPRRCFGQRSRGVREPPSRRGGPPIRQTKSAFYTRRSKVDRPPTTPSAESCSTGFATVRSSNPNRRGAACTTSLIRHGGVDLVPRHKHLDDRPRRVGNVCCAPCTGVATLGRRRRGSVEEGGFGHERPLAAETACVTGNLQEYTTYRRIVVVALRSGQTSLLAKDGA